MTRVYTSFCNNFAALAQNLFIRDEKILSAHETAYSP